MEPIKLEYKTYEQLKEELGSEYDTAMYEINMSALHEIERLDNILNKLEKWLEENRYHNEEYDGVLTYLRKLKGDDK